MTSTGSGRFLVGSETWPSYVRRHLEAAAEVAHRAEPEPVPSRSVLFLRLQAAGELARTGGAPVLTAAAELLTEGR